MPDERADRLVAERRQDLRLGRARGARAQARRALELAVSLEEGLLQGLARAGGIAWGETGVGAPTCEEGAPRWVGVRVQHGRRVEGDHVEVQRIWQGRGPQSLAVEE
jgi:hypothetical protein